MPPLLYFDFYLHSNLLPFLESLRCLSLRFTENKEQDRD